MKPFTPIAPPTHSQNLIKSRPPTQGGEVLVKVYHFHYDVQDIYRLPVGRDQANAGSARDASPSAIPSAASNSELGKESRSMPGYFPFPDEESFLKRRPARPSGSLGKPNDGGYSLPYTLGWDETSYRAVQVRVLIHLP